LAKQMKKKRKKKKKTPLWKGPPEKQGLYKNRNGVGKKTKVGSRKKKKKKKKEGGEGALKKNREVRRGERLIWKKKKRGRGAGRPSIKGLATTRQKGGPQGGLRRGSPKAQEEQDAEASRWLKRKAIPLRVRSTPQKKGPGKITGRNETGVLKTQWASRKCSMEKKRPGGGADRDGP